MEKILSEDYCSYELSKLLKEKGFPFIDHLYMYVDANNRFMTDHSACLTLSTEEYCKHFDELFTPTITHQMAMKWLRDKYNIDIEIDPDIRLLGIKVYIPKISTYTDKLQYKRKLQYRDNDGIITAYRYYFKYEKAVEAALKYSLENLI